ncbi:MAG: response regulator transcription factor [bacterium]|nr:response regulator transcription factor [bacterium]
MSMEWGPEVTPTELPVTAEGEPPSSGRETKGSVGAGGEPPSSGRRRVLVVEDEPHMREIVGFVLDHHGYEVVLEGSAEAGWRRIQHERFDAMVLDVMLGDVSGIDLCVRIRSRSRTPIIFLSALSTPEERIAGLEAGADDYLGKPFSPRELVLRVNRLVERSLSDPGELRWQEVRVDAARPIATLGERRVVLTATSHQILSALVRAQGASMTWREILNEVWATSAPQGGKQMVKTAIYRLRRELGDDEARLVETVRGSGYRLGVVTKL